MVSVGQPRLQNLGLISNPMGHYRASRRGQNCRIHLLETPCTSSPDYWVGLEERRQEDEREDNCGGFAWRRDEEEEGGGEEENGEDYDDCYCEDCVVGGTYFKIDQISQTKKALLPAMFCLRYIFGSVYV